MHTYIDSLQWFFMNECTAQTYKLAYIIHSKQWKIKKKQILQI